MLTHNLLVSSPRTWGCFLFTLFTLFTYSVFPTHVGVFPVTQPVCSTRQSLPHARGGVSGSLFSHVKAPGSSPRTWGCFCCKAYQKGFHSVFPTHVGVFLLLKAPKKCSRRLPHARGGVSDKNSARKK